jgi:hypothetical protein
VTAEGVHHFLAGGNGGKGGGGAGGKGGDVQNVTGNLGDANLTIAAGGGGEGGSFYKAPEVIGQRKVVTGRGPYGEVYYDYIDVLSRPISRNGVGGAGGAVANLTLSALGAVDSDYLITGGDGGGGQARQAGGKAGGMTNVKLSATGTVSGFAVGGGTGGPGSADEKSLGGAGGSVTKLTLDVTGTFGGASVLGGDGGSGNSKAGAGGSVIGVHLTGSTAFSAEVNPGSGSAIGKRTDVVIVPAPIPVAGAAGIASYGAPQSYLSSGSIRLSSSGSFEAAVSQTQFSVATVSSASSTISSFAVTRAIDALAALFPKEIVVTSGGRLTVNDSWFDARPELKVVFLISTAADMDSATAFAAAHPTANVIFEDRREAVA